jgi:hypothetical protein
VVGHFNHGSRAHLSPRDLVRFDGPSLFDKLARAVCAADCLPRKELYESWEVARRVRRRFSGGRVVDLACGHALTAWIMLIFDATSPNAVAVDTRLPKNISRLHTALAASWPAVAARITLHERDLAQEPLHESDVVVATHACGGLTDLVLDRAIAARARVAVLPCCHDARSSDQAGLGGWLPSGLAIDVARSQRLIRAGYRVYTQTIPESITPQNRLLLGEPEVSL